MIDFITKLEYIYITKDLELSLVKKLIQELVMSIKVNIKLRNLSYLKLISNTFSDKTRFNKAL